MEESGGFWKQSAKPTQPTMLTPAAIEILVTKELVVKYCFVFFASATTDMFIVSFFFGKIIM